MTASRANRPYGNFKCIRITAAYFTMQSRCRGNGGIQIRVVERQWEASIYVMLVVKQWRCRNCTLKCRGQLLEQSPRRTRQVRLECGLNVSPSIRQAATARLAVDSRMLRRPCWWVDGIRPAIYTRIERLIHTRENAAALRTACQQRVDAADWFAFGSLPFLTATSADPVWQLLFMQLKALVGNNWLAGSTVEWSEWAKERASQRYMAVMGLF